MATTDIQAYKIIYDSTTGLMDVATAIDTKYSNAPYNYTGIDTRVATIKGASGLPALWAVILSLINENMSADDIFTSGNLCALAGAAISNSDNATAKLLEGMGGIVEGGSAGKFLQHLKDHLDSILAGVANQADCRSKLDHVIADIGALEADLDIFKAAFDSIEDLLKRINKALSLLSFSLGCADDIIDELAGTPMRDYYADLGIGSTQAAAEASVVNKALTSVNTYRAESLDTRFATMRSDVKTNDGWDDDMDDINTDATNSYSNISNYSTPF
jgi:hypothetical protein